MTSAHPPLQAVNDFVVKFANVNGSGSASANELFAKAILRMGVPVSPRNIFPSNIQGLPTWYEVRVCERGWLGRRGGVDLMVAMNPQTWDADIAEIEIGGYLFYDNSKPLPKSKFRDDIHVLGVPLTEICNATYSDPRQRQLFKGGLWGRAVPLPVTATENHRQHQQGGHYVSPGALHHQRFTNPVRPPAIRAAVSASATSGSSPAGTAM